MKKLLMIFAVLALFSCASTKQTGFLSVYKQELKERKITNSDYNYLMHGQNELHEMNKDR